MTDQEASYPWHACSAEDVLIKLGSSKDGLDRIETLTRLRRYGPNILPAADQPSPLRRFLAQFNSGLIYFLLAAAVASFALGHAIDASVICLVVLVNATVGFIQEGKAEQALSAIGRLIAHSAPIMRDGERKSIDVVDIVPGDILLLEPGQKVPADARLILAKSLAVDEAILTGESVAREKSASPVTADAVLADRASMVFSGTMIVRGQGTAVVTGTGPSTEVGRISGLIQQVETLSTPLLRQINRFTVRFTELMLLGAMALFAFLILARDFEWSRALMMVVALAVGLIPEGLPAVITITLAIGVRRMAARNAVIRKLPAVETLGAVSVICTDKTGTLTRNEMMVRRVFTGCKEILVDGAGYSPEGKLSDQHASAAHELARCGLLCNDARLHQEIQVYSVEGDPMEGALVAFAMKAGLDTDAERGAWKRLDVIPFDAEHRYMATLHQSPSGDRIVFLKGAPEVVLDMVDDPQTVADWHAHVAASAAEGERLLGFAMMRLDVSAEKLSTDTLKNGMTPLGLAGFIDPPRKGAQDAIIECRQAGIEVKMITGDHAATALAIARQLHLADNPKVVTGGEIEELEDARLQEVVASASVFARASPEHKLRIVKALQAGGQIVAMTGDGVNDAPSLKQADVGTAMGRKGTDVSRETAEMVLLDDNFASIVAAVREGRTVFDNIRKVIAWTLPTNGGESVVVLLAILIGFTLPMTATQILWINLITDSALGLALAFEPSERGIMERRPRRANEPLLSGFMLWRTVLVSMLFAALSLSVFFAVLDSGRGVEVARTMVVNMLVVGGVFYLFNVRYMHGGSITLRGVLGTKALLISLAVVVVSQLLFTYLPAMNAIFASRPLTMTELGLIGALGVGFLVFLEGEKLAIRKLGWFEDSRGKTLS